MTLEVFQAEMNEKLKSVGASLDSMGKKTLKQVEDSSGKTLDDAQKKVKSLLNN
jgi:hypothetical protein